MSCGSENSSGQPWWIFSTHCSSAVCYGCFFADAVCANLKVYTKKPFKTERLWLTDHIFKAHHRVSFPKNGLLGIVVQKCAGGLRCQDRLHKGLHCVVEKTTRALGTMDEWRWVEMSGKLWCKNVPCISRNCKISGNAIFGLDDDP